MKGIREVLILNRHRNIRSTKEKLQIFGEQMKSVKMKYLPHGKIKLLPEIVNFDKNKIDIDGPQNGKVASD